MFIKAKNKTALVWKERAISYKDLLVRINLFADLFKEEKAKKVLIFSENRPEWIYALYAGWKNEASVVPVDFMSGSDELAYILSDSKPEVLFYSKDTEAKVLESIEISGVKPLLFNLDKIDSDKIINENTHFPALDSEKNALILYTSGTTGSPKGVMLSFLNIETNIIAVSKEIYNENSRVLALLPFHHILPLMGTIAVTFYNGATTIGCPTLNAAEIIAIMQKHKPTILIGVPRFYEMLRKGIKDKINKSIVTKTLFFVASKIDFLPLSKIVFGSVHRKFGGHLESLVCGGAALDYAVSKDYRTLGFELMNGYGMTEAAPMITFPRPGKIRIGSAGQCLDDCDIKIEDGEIVAYGKHIMQGYFNKPEETAETIKEGWLYTGDLGYLDSDGYLFITGRKKEIIVLPNGKNIDPVEIEFKLKNTSDIIAEVGVFIKDNILQAVFYPDFSKIKDAEITNLDEAFRWDVVDKYNKGASSYKKIMQFNLVKNELPKTRLGKLRRFMLPTFADEMLKSKTDIVEPDFEEYAMIKDFLIKQTEKAVHPEDHFEIDLGMDSLDKVSLLVFLKSSFGTELAENELMQTPTVVKLAEFIREKKTKIETEEIDWAGIIKENVSLKLPGSSWIHIFLKHLFALYVKSLLKITSDGHNSLPKGPFIIACNHQTSIDALFVTSFMKDEVLKNTYFFAKKKHFDQGWRKFMAERNNIIVMDINRDVKVSLQKMADVLKQGKNIIIFPEGTRSRDGKLGMFKKTFAILSKELNVPIVPVGISGAWKALPKGSFLLKPYTKIKIKYLAPIFPEKHSYDSLRDSVFEKIKSNVE